jgi:hypothetical protein
MNDDMFLDDGELRSMTKRVQRAAQAKMLRSMGIAFKQRADGTLAVLRMHVEKEFGAGRDRQSKAKDFEPNWSGLNA